MIRISEGAESVVYAGGIAGISCIVKRRIQKRYRIDALDMRLRISRTKSEARIISAAFKAGVNTPRVLLIDGFDLYIERLDGATMNKMVGLRGTEKFRIMCEAGRNLGLLHNADITHGDYTPANIMVDSGAVYVIDFGLAEQTTSIEEKAIDLLLMKRSVEKLHYKAFERAYARASNDGAGTIGRLREIELRGRYQTRTLNV